MDNLDNRASRRIAIAPELKADPFGFQPHHTYGLFHSVHAQQNGGVFPNQRNYGAFIRTPKLNRASVHLECQWRMAGMLTMVSDDAL